MTCHSGVSKSLLEQQICGVMLITFAVRINGPILLCLIVCLINNQVLRKIKIVVENDVKNWAYVAKSLVIS